MTLKVYYGTASKFKDVTEIALYKLYKEGMIIIPKGDVHRAAVFGDPVFGVKKIVRVKTDTDETTYDDATKIVIAVPKLLGLRRQWHTDFSRTVDPAAELNKLHQELVITGGNLKQEYPEQLLIMTYLDENATVLELGSNIGRNTCVIASILTDSRRLVTLECSPASAKILAENRRLNGFEFQIEVAALSKVKLAQRHWNTVVYQDVVPKGYEPVQTISFPELQAKYNLGFDTLVADCEGALYQILRDEPTFLTNIKTVIVENDYSSVADKQFVDSELTRFGFELLYSAHGPKVAMPCADEFYQVFKRV